MAGIEKVEAPKSQEAPSTNKLSSEAANALTNKDAHSVPQGKETVPPGTLGNLTITQEAEALKPMVEKFMDPKTDLGTARQDINDMNTSLKDFANAGNGDTQMATMLNQLGQLLKKDNFMAMPSAYDKSEFGPNLLAQGKYQNDGISANLFLNLSSKELVVDGTANDGTSFTNHSPRVKGGVGDAAPVETPAKKPAAPTDTGSGPQNYGGYDAPSEPAKPQATAPHTDVLIQPDGSISYGQDNGNGQITDGSHTYQYVTPNQ